MLNFCWIKLEAEYKLALANLFVSLRLNTFTQTDLTTWLNESFTPLTETKNDA